MPWKSKKQARYICWRGYGKGEEKYKKMCDEFWKKTPPSLWKRLPEKKSK